MNLEKISKDITKEFLDNWKSVGPELKINKEKREVYIYPNLFFSQLTKIYYTIKGYTAFIQEKPFL
jgi:hypothetical protein